MWFVAALFSLLAATGLLVHYAERSTTFIILLTVGFSWSLGFSYFLFLPFDIEHAMCSACLKIKAGECSCLPSPGIESLESIIPLAYGITMLLAYLMNDLVREFLSSGEFTARGRARDALHSAAYFYIPAVVLGLVLIFYLVFTTGVSFSQVRQIGRGMMNTIGLFILIAFLGYGLVEVPRMLWNKGNTEGQVRYLKFRVATQSEAVQNARRRLEETLELVHATNNQLSQEKGAAPRLQVYMRQLLQRCPASSPAAPIRPASESGTPTAPTASPARPFGGLFGGASASITSAQGSSRSAERPHSPTTRKQLVSLHARLKLAIANERRARSMYELYLRKALRMMALADNNAAATGSARVYRRVLKPAFYRATSVCCMALSGIFIWCEGTILFDDAPFNLNLSPLSLFFRLIGSSGGGFGALVLLYIALLYCALCTYYAMFTMRLCEGTTLYPHGHSDASSLLFNATYACRLGPPLCFNFLKLLHEKDSSGVFRHSAETTYFTKTAFGTMDQIPLFGNDYFSNYAPLLIVILCGCTYLNLGSTMMGCCSACLPCFAAPAFSFDEDFSDTRIDHGAQIIAREKRALADGVPLGTNLQLLSGATSDGEDASRVRVGAGNSGTTSRWNRLNDDNL